MAFTQEQMAQELGLSRAAVGKCFRDGMPMSSPEAARAWRERHVAPYARQDGAAQERPADYHLARARREQAEARIAELKQAELEGALIRLDAVRSVAAGVLAATREALLQIPARMATVLAAEDSPARVHELLQQELHLALAQLAAMPERVGADAQEAAQA